jgi:oligopeptide/dipeptide ABC transporter ATP-binding protein
MSAIAETDVLVRVERVSKLYQPHAGLLERLLGRQGRAVQALSGVDLRIGRGETVGLIGESGCGKSTLGRAILHLRPPSAGRVLFDETDLGQLSPAALKAMRRRMQIVFQNPYASLNPRKTTEQILALPLRLHGLAKRGEIRGRIVAMLENVGLKAAHLDRYPHQFSGGQRQRIAIARALILRPEFVVCDEPVSALDVSVQAQVIDLLTKLKRELGLTYLFISHDIAVIGCISDRVAVMYLGEIVESGATAEVLQRPHHPYTKALLSAVPRIDRAFRQERIRLTGDLPSPLNPPPGCRFHTRCGFATDRCRSERPLSRTLADGRTIACHHFPTTGC